MIQYIRYDKPNLLKEFIQAYPDCLSYKDKVNFIVGYFKWNL